MSKPHWIWSRRPEDGEFYSVQLWTGRTVGEETGCDVEDLYQAFKERLMAEVVADNFTGTITHLPLVSKEPK